MVLAKKSLWLNALGCLFSFSSISMYITRVPMGGTWAPTYDSRLLNIGNVTHYSLQGAFLDIPRGSFHSLRTIHGPSVSESDLLLTNNRRRSTGDCLMREDGKRPLILKRKGVLAEKACPVGFRVEVNHLLYIQIPILPLSSLNTNTILSTKDYMTVSLRRTGPDTTVSQIRNVS